MADRSALETKTHGHVEFVRWAPDVVELTVRSAGDDYVTIVLTQANLRRLIEAATEVLGPE